MPTTSLTLQVQPGTDVLHRVVCVCRRRNLQILALTYVKHEIALTVSGDDRQARGIGRWLSALVHVSQVQHTELAATAAVTPDDSDFPLPSTGTARERPSFVLRPGHA